MEEGPSRFRHGSYKQDKVLVDRVGGKVQKFVNVVFERLLPLNWMSFMDNPLLQRQGIHLGSEHRS